MGTLQGFDASVVKAIDEAASKLYGDIYNTVRLDPSPDVEPTTTPDVVDDFDEVMPF